MEISTLMLLTLWASFFILDPILFGAIKGRKSRWGSYWWVWFSTLVLTGLLLIFFITSQSNFQSFAQSIGMNITNSSG